MVKDIAVVSPDISITNLFEKIRSQTPIDFSLSQGLLQDAVPVAQELVRQGATVLVSRGETTRFIRKALPSVATVDIPISLHDVIGPINQARAFGNRIAVIGFGEAVRAASALSPVLSSLEMKIFSLRSCARIREALEEAKTEDFEIVVGVPVVVANAEKLGLQGFAIGSNESGLLSALNEAVKLAEFVRRERDLRVRQQVFIDSIGAGALFLDNQGRVIQDNLPYPLGATVKDAFFKEVQGQRVLAHGGILAAIGAGETWKGNIRGAHDVPYECRVHPVVSNDKNLGSVVVVEQFSSSSAFTSYATLQDGFVARYQFSDCLAESANMRKVLADARKYAEVDLPVLIAGESGTGKEVMAQSIHNASRRRHGPFVAVNCAALPEHLLESELFGYQEGAFTGARKGGKPGLCEMANSGTLFLDEIGEFPVSLQAKLLRVLDDQKVMRLGSERFIRVNARLLCATNQDLKKLVAEGRFRSDLFHRINVLRLTLPPLRERRECVGALIRHYLQRICSRLERPEPQLSPAALEVLLEYDYPGNIRELRSILERLAITCGDRSPSREDLADLLDMPVPGGTPATDQAPEDDSRGLLYKEEMRLIHQVLVDCQGNRRETARRLGISPATLWRRLHKA